MTLVKVKRSRIVSAFRSVSFTANTQASIGSFLFRFNKEVQVKSIMFYVAIANPVQVYGFFLDESGNYQQVIPVQPLFGFGASASQNPGFALQAGSQVFFENQKAFGIQFQNAISSVTQAGALVNVFVEIIEEVYEEM